MKQLYLCLIICPWLIIANCTEKTEEPKEMNSATQFNPQFQFSYIVENNPDIYYGELIYIPIYSDIFYKDERKTLKLYSTLSIHNTDLAHSITLSKVYFHGTKGNLIRKYLDEKRILQPLETVHYIVQEEDKTGGSGANFIIEWNTETDVSSPIVEAVMVTTQMQQGISFTTNGKVIKKFGKSVIIK